MNLVVPDSVGGVGVGLKGQLRRAWSCALLGLAIAAEAPAEPARSRALLPAVEVERPVLLPQGWTELQLDHAGEASGVRLAHGMMDGLALALELERRWSSAQALHPRLGLQLGPLPAEPPPRSIGLRADWWAPDATAKVGGSELALQLRVAPLPCRLDAQLGAGAGPGGAYALASLGVACQAGPLVALGALSGAGDGLGGGVGARGGLMLDLSRGLGLQVELHRAVQEGGPLRASGRPAGRDDLRLLVRVRG